MNVAKLFKIRMLSSNPFETNNILLQIVVLTVLLNGVFSSLSDVTSNVFNTKHPEGIIAAFGDFDSNKATDIFVLSSDGTSVFVYEAKMDLKTDDAVFSKTTFISGDKSDAKITSVVPGDFKYDAQMDVLVTRQKDTKSSHVTVDIYDGEKSKAFPYLTLNETLKDQPVVIDANGDMIPDLFGETKDGQRAYWIFHKDGSYKMVPVTNFTSTDLPPLRTPHSSAFLDINGDLAADLCAVSEKDGMVMFEFWLNVDGTLTWDRNVAAPAELKVIGQPSFGDFNGNHELNIILPGCLDADCKDAAVFIWTGNKYSLGRWYQLDIDFKSDHDKDTLLSFPKEVKVTDWLSLPIALRIGDFNLDGYPDAIAVLSDDKGELSTHLMYNVECSSSKCGGFSRTFNIDTSRSLLKGQPSVATFFDLKENGVLDVVMTERDSADKLVMRAVEQDFTGDASFLKVVVVSGLCNENCPSGNTPYGVNQVGPVVKFESTTPTGREQIGVASQLSQSSYFSLQLPFVVFGLGQTPNFVDELEVGIPYPKGKSRRRHTWSTLIPNSQIIVIPYPVSDPSNWYHELYVTPSRLVMLTGVSLLGTCAFISIIVGLLHWRERIEDKKEKLQESQRFHFDAM